MIYQGSSRATIPNKSFHGTLCKARNADAADATVIARATDRSSQRARNPVMTGIFANAPWRGLSAAPGRKPQKLNYDFTICSCTLVRPSWP
jgi:hypothetical protein